MQIFGMKLISAIVFEEAPSLRDVCFVLLCHLIPSFGREIADLPSADGAWGDAWLSRLYALHSCDLIVANIHSPVSIVFECKPEVDTFGAKIVY